MSTELEWKYAVPNPAVLAELPAWEGFAGLFDGPPKQYHMQTVYLDTDDRRLAAANITLRRRMENQTSVVCCKAPLPGADPASGKLRGEWELAADDVAAALPVLVERGAPKAILEAAAAGLAPVCAADFLRTARPLRLPDGTTAELALDSGSLLGQIKLLPFCEVELELKSGDPEACRALIEALAAARGLRPQPLSKYARAKRLP